MKYMSWTLDLRFGKLHKIYGLNSTMLVNDKEHRDLLFRNIRETLDQIQKDYPKGWTEEIK